jgi:rhamnosyltransferase
MSISQINISVIIPVLNAAPYLPELIPAILKQKPFAPNEIILINSNSAVNTVEIALRFPNVHIININTFSHGGARNLGAKKANGLIVVFLTQDALPHDENWIFYLIEPFKNENVAAVYSRQIPKTDALLTERFFLKRAFLNQHLFKKKEQQSK